MFFFPFFVFETPLKDFPFYSPFLTHWFRYLQTCITESCIYLSNQLYFKTPHETLKFQEKSKKNAFFQRSTGFKNVPSVSSMGPHHRSFGKCSCRQKCLDKILENMISEDWWDSIIVCIVVSTPLQKYYPPHLCQALPLKSANCPSHPFFRELTSSIILVFRDPPIKVGFFCEPKKY